MSQNPALAGFDVFTEPAPPVGFDPAAMFAGGLTSPDAGIVVLRPWRLRWGKGADLAVGKPPAVCVARDRGRRDMHSRRVVSTTGVAAEAGEGQQRKDDDRQ